MASQTIRGALLVFVIVCALAAVGAIGGQRQCAVERAAPTEHGLKAITLNTQAYESFPAGTHVPVRRGETLYMHCYAANFSAERPGGFHHMVRVLYW